LRKEKKKIKPPTAKKSKQSLAGFKDKNPALIAGGARCASRGARVSNPRRPQHAAPRAAQSSTSKRPQAGPAEEAWPQTQGEAAALGQGGCQPVVYYYSSSARCCWARHRIHPGGAAPASAAPARSLAGGSLAVDIAGCAVDHESTPPARLEAVPKKSGAGLIPSKARLHSSTEYHADRGFPPAVVGKGARHGSPRRRDGLLDWLVACVVPINRC